MITPEPTMVSTRGCAAPTVGKTSVASTAKPSRIGPGSYTSRYNRSDAYAPRGRAPPRPRRRRRRRAVRRARARVHVGQRPARAAAGRPPESHRVVPDVVPRRLAQRGARGHRHRALPRAPDVQGHADVRAGSVRPPRRAERWPGQRVHLAGRDLLLREHRRRPHRPRDRPRVRPHAQSEARRQGHRLRARGRHRGAPHAHRGRSRRAPRRGSGVDRLQEPSVRRADHRLHGGHQADHARGDPRLLQDLLHAEPEVARRVPARDALDDPVRGPRLAPVQAARLRAPARAGGGRRLQLLRAGPESLLVLGHADARPDTRGDGEGAAGRDGDAQDGAGDRRGAAAREEPGRGHFRLPGGLRPPSREPARPVRADRRLRRQGPLPRAPARGDRRRRPARGARVLPRRQEKRRRAPAAALMRGLHAVRFRKQRDWAMRLRRLSVGFVVLAVLLALPAAAAKPIAHREVLPNGIVLLVAERPAVPIIVVRTFAHAGAVLDPPDRAGLANLTGALLTRGTAKHTGPELDSAIEFVGGSLSAGAGRDGLSAALAVLKKDLGLGLDLLAEVLLTPTFPPDEVKRKVAQIQAAIKRSEEDPGTVANRALARLVFPNHPYGRPVEGTIESVGKLTRDDVARFHGANVRPDTTIITVVGAITVDDARREVLARFGGWKPPAEPPASVPPAAAAGPPQSETIEKDLTQATILLGRQALRQTQ